MNTQKPFSPLLFIRGERMDEEQGRKTIYKEEWDAHRKSSLPF
jgi:hypothetical protein